MLGNDGSPCCETHVEYLPGNVADNVLVVIPDDGNDNVPDSIP